MPRPEDKGLPPGLQKQVDDGDLKANLGKSHLADQVAALLGEDSNVIAGTDGDDALTATDAADVIVMSGGNDTVADFSVENDLIDLSFLLEPGDETDDESGTDGSGGAEDTADDDTTDEEPSSEDDTGAEDDDATSVDETLDGDSEDDTADEASDDNASDDGAETDAEPIDEELAALVTQLLETAEDTEDGVLITTDKGSILLAGVSLDELSEANFVRSPPEGETTETASGTESEDESTDGMSDDAAVGVIFRLYKAAFGRTPDDEGLAFWSGEATKGLAIASIATGFMDSEEFGTIFGADSSDVVFVENLYLNILGREGDDEGVAFWKGYLENGGAREDVLIGFSESEENLVGVQQDMADAGLF